jgi:predicted permease
LASLLAALVGAVVRLGPQGFRDRYAPEIVRTMDEALEQERSRRGRLAMTRLGLRGLLDALRTVHRERRLAADPAGRGPLSDWRGDVRYAVRSWRRTPAFSLTVVLMLGLSLGLAAAIFSFADGYLFRSLPFPMADRLYSVRDPQSRIGMLLASDTVALRESAVSDLGFVEWSIGGPSGRLRVGDRGLDPLIYEVSRGFRTTVPLPLVRGRDFSDDDHRAGASPVAAWLSFRFWHREFGGDESVIGRTFRMDNGRTAEDVLVVGVLGPTVASFDLNNPPPDLVVPERGPISVGPNTYSQPMIRLPDGETADQALKRIGNVLQSVAPGPPDKPRVVRLRSVQESQVAGGRPTARVFFAGALLVLVLAAINLVHLMLTRGVSRGAEIATRRALGATPWRIVRLFATESVVLGAAGIGLGLLAGWWMSGVIAANVPTFPTAGRNLSLVPMQFDARVIAVAIGLGLMVVLVGAVWPAWRAIRRPMTPASRSASGVVASLPRRVSRSVLASELAVAAVVMIGTVFIGVGIWRYLHPALGYDYTDRYRVTLLPAESRPLNAVEVGAALEALKQVPGLQAAAPFDLTAVREAVEIPGQSIDPKSVAAVAVTPGYFEAWQLRLTAGRWFESREFSAAPDVVVVTDALVRLVWPDADPIGREVRVGGIARRVAGVIQSPRRWLSSPPPPQVLVPAPPAGGLWSFVAWLPGVPGAEADARLERAMQPIVPDGQVGAVLLKFNDLFLREAGEAQFQAPIVAAFGAMAFVLAGIGIFGLVSYLVAHRLREFGIRLALGAQRRDIWRSVVAESVLPAVIGLAIGIPGALALESVVQATAFGWKSSGSLAAAIVSVTLLIVAAVAAIPPARRAMRVDPVQVLRAD